MNLQLNPAALNVIIEGAPPAYTITLSLDKLPLEQLYTLQKQVQHELQYREDIVHDELQVMEEKRAHYVELCSTLRKDKEEIIEESQRLKTTIQ